MPRSCKCILDTMVHKGAMTEDMRAKILRKLQAGDAAANEARRLRGVIDSAVRRIEAVIVEMQADNADERYSNTIPWINAAVNIIREEDGNG